MLLADAIEAWGQEHRSGLERHEIERLGEVWTTVRRAELGFDIEAMTKEDASMVMGLFEKEERREVSSTLNSVRTWALARSEAQPDKTPVVPHDAQTDLPPGVVADVQTPTSSGTPVAGVTPIPSGAPLSPVDVNRGSQAPRSQPPAPQGPVAGMTAPPGMDTGEPDNQNKLILGLIALAVLALIVYFGFIRGGDDDADVVTTADNETQSQTQAQTETQDAGADGTDGATASNDGQTTTDFTGGGSDDFCGLARQYDEVDPLEGVSFFDGQAFFEQTLALWANVQRVAPPELGPDIANVTAGLTSLRDVAAQYDNNFADPAFGAAIAAIDTTAMDASGENIELYVEQVCGVSFNVGNDASSGATGAGPDLSELDNLSDAEAEAFANSILESLGVTPELAECLNRELGDIDSAQADPELLTKPVCGTTLLEVMTNIGG